jgi:hypothetical protein
MDRAIQSEGRLPRVCRDPGGAIVNIRTEAVFPPIPLRQFDWMAYDDDGYDGAPDAGHQIVGNGPTEQAAIADFQEQWREDHPIGCHHCGATKEHVEMMAAVAGIVDPICCDDSAWGGAL